MKHEFVNEFRLGGYIEYKPLNFTTNKGNPFVTTLLRVERVIREDRVFNLRFDINAYNQEVVEKLIVLEKQAFVVFKGNLARDTFTTKDGKTTSKTKLVVTEIEFIDITGEPFKESKATQYHKRKGEGELQVPSHLKDDEPLDIKKMAKEIEEHNSKKDLSKIAIDVEDDDLPF